MEYCELIDLAKKAMKNSYSPYSKFKVGVALLAGSGKIYLGTNIENASYGASICAERVATVKAISEGEKELVAIALTCNNPEIVCYPCGICRQFLSEFGNPDIIVTKNGEFVEIKKLSSLLPNSFSSNDLQ